MRPASTVTDTSLTLLHDVVDLLGACRVPALRTVPGLSALSGVLDVDVDVAFALITLEEMGVVERIPYLDGCLAWRIRNVFNWPAMVDTSLAAPPPRAISGSPVRVNRTGGALC